MKKQLFHCAILVATTFTVFQAQAQLTGYTNRIQIALNNVSNQCAINTQVKLVVNTKSLILQNKMQSDGSDIRFSKDCKGLKLNNYWIESGINTSSTVIWVKVDSIPAGGSRQIYLFSGNPSAQAVSSIPLTFDYAGSSTDSVASGTAGGVSNCQRGFRFSPKEDILVTKLGKMEPDGDTRYITLFDQASQAIIVQQQVSGLADQYSYAALPQPIWLHEGQQYNLQMYQGSNAGYYFGISSQIDSRLIFYDMRYCNNCTQNSFPNDSLSNYQYGYPDMEFYYRTKVTPEPVFTIDSLNTSPLQISATNAICKGQSTTLFASGCDSYIWSNNSTGASISVSPLLTASYSVTGFLTGCPYYAFKTIQVNALPAVTVTASSTLFCAGETITLTASGAQNYVWSNDGSSAEIRVMPNTTTTYSVSGFNQSGCSSSVNLTLQESNCVGLKTFKYQENNLNIYPNPGNGQFYIHGSEHMSLDIVNELGQLVKKVELKNENNYTVELRIEEAGIYFAVGNNSKSSFHAKIVISD